MLIRFIHSGVSWILLSDISADGAERERERKKMFTVLHLCHDSVLQNLNRRGVLWTNCCVFRMTRFRIYIDVM